MKKVISIFILSLNLFAANMKIGTIAVLRGNVHKVNIKGKKVKCKNNGPVYTGDIISTDIRSFVKILMKDDTIMTLGPKGKMSFDKFEFKTKSDRKNVVSLIKGKLRSLYTVKPKNKNSLKLSTPNAAMGIRGTEILTNVSRQGRDWDTDILLLSGEVDLDISKLNVGDQRTIKLNVGKLFNSSLVKQLNTPIKSLRDVSPQSMRALKSSPNIFLPDVSSSDLKDKVEIKLDVKVLKLNLSNEGSTGSSRLFKSNSEKKVNNRKVTKQKIQQMKKIFGRPPRNIQPGAPLPGPGPVGGESGSGYTGGTQTGDGSAGGGNHPPPPPPPPPAGGGPP